VITTKPGLTRFLRTTASGLLRVDAAKVDVGRIGAYDGCPAIRMLFSCSPGRAASCPAHARTYRGRI
jgi:hypothetical protein